jgi:hypothetical protein
MNASNFWNDIDPSFFILPLRQDYSFKGGFGGDQLRLKAEGGSYSAKAAARTPHGIQILPKVFMQVENSTLRMIRVVSSRCMISMLALLYFYISSAKAKKIQNHSSRYVV